MMPAATRARRTGADRQEGPGLLADPRGLPDLDRSATRSAPTRRRALRREKTPMLSSLRHPRPRLRWPVLLEQPAEDRVGNTAPGSVRSPRGSAPEGDGDPRARRAAPSSATRRTVRSKPATGWACSSYASKTLSRERRLGLHRRGPLQLDAVRHPADAAEEGRHQVRPRLQHQRLELPAHLRREELREVPAQGPAQARRQGQALRHRHLPQRRRPDRGPGLRRPQPDLGPGRASDRSCASTAPSTARSGSSTPASPTATSTAATTRATGASSSPTGSSAGPTPARAAEATRWRRTRSTLTPSPTRGR